MNKGSLGQSFKLMLFDRDGPIQCNWGQPLPLAPLKLPGSGEERATKDPNFGPAGCLAPLPGLEVLAPVGYRVIVLPCDNRLIGQSCYQSLDTTLTSEIPPQVYPVDLSAESLDRPPPLALATNAYQHLPAYHLSINGGLQPGRDLLSVRLVLSGCTNIRILLVYRFSPTSLVDFILVSVR
jgi:hypothetical protein